MKVLILTMTAVTCAAPSFAQASRCEPAEVRRAAGDGRDLVAAGRDASQARDTWKQVLDCGGAIGWRATLYSVDARATFVFAFDRTGIDVYREKGAQPEASIPWSEVREIEAGNWVIWFRMRTPIEITSDRGKRKRVKELKVFLHGGDGGQLTYYWSGVEWVGRDWLWGTPVYEFKNLRGIAVGPTEYQRRVQRFLAETFDPAERIVLKQKGRGAGW